MNKKTSCVIKNSIGVRNSILTTTHSNFIYWQPTTNRTPAYLSPRCSWVSAISHTFSRQWRRTWLLTLQQQLSRQSNNLALWTQWLQQRTMTSTVAPLEDPEVLGSKLLIYANKAQFRYAVIHRYALGYTARSGSGLHRYYFIYLPCSPHNFYDLHLVYILMWAQFLPDVTLLFDSSNSSSVAKVVGCCGSLSALVTTCKEAVDVMAPLIKVSVNM